MKYVWVLAVMLAACVHGPCEEEPQATPMPAESYLDWSEQFSKELHDVDAEWATLGAEPSCVRVNQTTIWRWSAPAVYAECSGAAFCHRCSSDGSCLLIVLDADSLGHESWRSIEEVKRAFAGALGDVNGRPDLVPLMSHWPRP
jgi:hypothetical protein